MCGELSLNEWGRGGSIVACWYEEEECKYCSCSDGAICLDVHIFSHYVQPIKY